jgi:hypothetical protein
LDLELLSDVLGYTGIGSACLPILFVLTFKKNCTQKLDNLLILLSLEYFIINILSLLMFTFFKTDQSFLFGFHYISETIILSFLLTKSLLTKRFLLLLCIILIGVIFNFFFLVYLGDFNADKFISITSNITLFIFSLNYILLLYNENIYDNLSDNGNFIIGTGVLFFAGIQYYFSLFESFIRSDTSIIFFYLWPIFQISGILYYLIFTYGLWKLKK